MSDFPFDVDMRTPAEVAYANQLHIDADLQEKLNLRDKEIADLQLEKQQLLYKNEALEKHNRALIMTNESMVRDSRELQAKSTCFRADAITSLKAIDLCILATITTQRQVLTHRQRNFRMHHIHQIILNEVASLGERKFTSYEDDY
jgi:hypothetical protein